MSKRPRQRTSGTKNKGDSSWTCSGLRRWKCCVKKKKLFITSLSHAVMWGPSFYFQETFTSVSLVLSVCAPGWPHIDDTLSSDFQHSERQHITTVSGPPGSGNKSIFPLFPQEVELTRTRLCLTFPPRRHPTLSQAGTNEWRASLKRF